MFMQPSAVHGSNTVIHLYARTAFKAVVFGCIIVLLLGVHVILPTDVLQGVYLMFAQSYCQLTTNI